MHLEGASVGWTPGSNPSSSPEQLCDLEQFIWLLMLYVNVGMIIVFQRVACHED